MKFARDTSFILRWASLFFLLAALVLTVFQLTSYSRARSQYPSGMTIAGVPVGGVEPQIAAQRLLEVYSSPVEIQYAGNIIHLDPNLVGFSLDIDSMLAAADIQRTGQDFWSGFFGYLWGQNIATSDIPLLAAYSEERLQVYLKDEISSRYDKPATPAEPVPGQVIWKAGEPGQELDMPRAIALIETALRSPYARTVALTYQRTNPGRSPIKNLEIMIKQIIDQAPFDGVVGVYLLDLQNGEEIHFGYDKNADIPTDPDLAFTASSTIKIPVMVSVYKNLGPNLNQSDSDLVLEMITKSENPATDALMRRMDEVRGPLLVTQDMKTLGLENTFIGGYFYDGAPLLQRFSTPSNQRTDVFTQPDAYNQTTPSEMGSLLTDLYQCSQNGGGALVAAFPEKINQSVCQVMIENLTKDRIGVLIEAGVPDGTRVAHKHGWISGPQGIIQNISDVGIVYTPSGNYVLVVYVYHPQQAVWKPVSDMITNISQAVYNYYNP